MTGADDGAAVGEVVGAAVGGTYDRS